MQDRPSVKKKQLAGLMVIGNLLIVGALGQMITLADYEWYKYSMNFLPPVWISIRYGISWLQRFLGIVVGGGLIAHRRWAGNIAIFLCVFDILAVYWRYPYQCLKNQSIVWDERWGSVFAGFGFPGVHPSSYVLHALIAAYVFDTLFFGIVLYYLTRSYVRDQLT